MTEGKEDLSNSYRRFFDAWESYVFKTPDMTALTPLSIIETGKTKLQAQRFERMFEDFRASLMFSLIKNNEKTNNKRSMFEQRVSTLALDEVGRLLEKMIEKTSSINSSGISKNGGKSEERRKQGEEGGELNKKEVKK